MPAPLRVLRDALGLGAHAFLCAGNNVGGDAQQLSAHYLSSVVRDVRVSAGFGLVPPPSPPLPPPSPCDAFALQVKNIGAGRLELNYCVNVLQQQRYGDQLHPGLQVGLGTEFL